MKQLTAEQIQGNWYKLRDFITESFKGERLEKLNEMYDYFEDRMLMAPASGKAAFHNAMVGGYVEHILHVIKFSQQICYYLSCANYHEYSFDCSFGFWKNLEALICWMCSKK